MHGKIGVIFTIVLYLTVINAAVCTVGESAWKDEYYAKYDFKSFLNLAVSNQRIDMTEIDYPLLNAAIFYETNKERAKAGLPVFGHSEGLEQAAQNHSTDMVKFGFFSHTSPVKGKETPAKRIALTGVHGSTSGENIAETFGIEYEPGKSIFPPDKNGGFFSYSYKGKPILNQTYIGFAETIVKQWMESPGHRANILLTNFKYLGTGAAHFSNKAFYNIDEFRCTQNFSDTKGGS